MEPLLKDIPLELTAEKTVRIYADVSADADMKLKLRALHHQMETGIRVTRKQYLEKLISDDIAKVNGASLREVTTRKIAPKSR